jgi:hypothetical protein
MRSASYLDGRRTVHGSQFGQALNVGQEDPAKGERDSMHPVHPWWGARDGFGSSPPPRTRGLCPGSSSKGCDRCGVAHAAQCAAWISPLHTQTMGPGATGSNPVNL